MTQPASNRLFTEQRATAFGTQASASAWDDFARADGDIAGTQCGSQQTYASMYDPSSTLLVIDGQRLVRGVPANYGRDGGSPAYTVTLGVVPTKVTMDFTLTNVNPNGGTATTLTFDPVIGATATDFQHTSVQLCSYPDHWLLFITEHEGGVPTTVNIATANYATPLVQDGQTRYRMSMELNQASSTVTMDLPDGTSATATDARLAEYWGPIVAVQIRRDYGTDGDAAIMSWAASRGIPGSPGSDGAAGVQSSLWLPGDTTSGVSTPAPASFPDDFTITCLLAPDSWAGNNGVKEQDICAQWQGASQQAWYLRLTTNHISMVVSTLGTDTVSVPDAAIIPGVATDGSTAGQAKWLQCVFTHNNGSSQCQAIYSDSPDGQTWTPFATTTGATGGVVLHKSTAPVTVGYRSATFVDPFKGRIAYLKIVNGATGALVCELDNRFPWGSTYHDDAGNLWTRSGTTSSWAKAAKLIA